MKLSRFILACCLLLAISGCSKSTKTDFFGEEEEAKKPKVSTVTKLTRHWRVSLGDKLRRGDAVLSPTAFGDHLYVASVKGKVEKLSLSDGERVWRNKLDKVNITAGVGVGSGLVLIGSDNGELFALRQSDGTQAWKTQLDSEILASPVVDGDTVVARSGDGKVYGISAFDGSTRWTISRQLPRLSIRGESRPVITQGVVFAGFSDGNMAAFEASTGRSLWDFPVAFARGNNEIDRLADVDTDPLLVGENLYVTSYQNVTRSINIQNQQVEWTAELASFNPLAYDAANLYVTDAEGVIHQVDRRSGEIKWSQEQLRYFSTSAPASVGAYVLVSEGDGGLYVLRKSDGALIGKHNLGASTIIGQPVVDGARVYLLDSNGSVQSLSITESQ